MLLVALERGARFQQSVDGYWVEGTPWHIVETTYDDIYAWLGVEDFHEYMNALVDEGPAIFDRATD